jgi:hypothetical protein
MAAAAVYPHVHVFKSSLLTSPVGVEELGPLRAMTATGAGLSLALNLHWKGTDSSATLLPVSF